jgi:hypothetical protein
MDAPARKRFHFSLRTLIIFCVSVGLALPLAVGIFNFFTTGHLAPIRIIETLNNPIPVDGWDADGLILSSGARLILPNVAHLKPGGVPLDEFLKNGVEQSNGRVYGIVKVWHWCGNDSCREHYARIDIGYLIEFCSAGELIEDISEVDVPPWVLPLRIGPYGWNISDYYTFISFVEHRRNGIVSTANSH